MARKKHSLVDMLPVLEAQAVAMSRYMHSELYLFNRNQVFMLLAAFEHKTLHSDLGEEGGNGV